MSGTVLDPDAKAVINAAVVVRGPAGITRAVATDATGRFSVAGLPAGTYVVEVTAPGFALARLENVQLSSATAEDLTIRLVVGTVTEEVTVSADLPAAAQVAPSQGSLTARSAQSEISGEFIRNYTSPIADYTQVTLMAPGTFSVSPNGVGLGDSKTFFRGFKDGYYSMTFDGIPFNDTNDPTHHSWAFFPGQQRDEYHDNITNLFVNFTVRGSSALAATRIQFAVNNLFDKHYITAVSAASTASNAPSPNDILTLTGGRSVSVNFTVGFSPR